MKVTSSTLKQNGTSAWRPRRRLARMRREILDSFGGYTQLIDYVVDGKLWYVSLHTGERNYMSQSKTGPLLLSAVGQSLSGNSLVGVVTMQICHNLCD